MTEHSGISNSFNSEEISQEIIEMQTTTPSGSDSISTKSSAACHLGDDTDETNFVQDTLIKWDLQEYIDHFIHEKINKDVFLQMPDDDIKILIEPYGDRHRFIINRQQFLDELKSSKSEKKTYVLGDQLRILLKSTIRGKCILAEPNLLNKADELTSIIADHIISLNVGLRGKKDQYLFWRNEIKAVWPDEILVDWYQPGFKRKAPSGKLYNKVTNIAKKYNATFKKLKVDERDAQSNNVKDSAKKYNSELSNVSLNDEKSILFLWEKTHEYRKENIDTISNYFERYRQLRTPLVKKLLELDFKLMKIADSNALLNTWPTLHKQILQIAKRKSNCAKLFVSIDNIPEDILAWKVLPYLFKPVSMKVGSKKPWRPSKEEQSNGFITWIHNNDQLNMAIKNQDTLCRNFKITRQPFVVAVGPLTKIVAAYVIINDERIKCNCVIDAVDFCWKASFALNTLYSTSSIQIWTFLEKEVYIKQGKENNVDEDSENNYQSVSKLRKALKNLASSQECSSSQVIDNELSAPITTDVNDTSDIE